LLLELVPVRPEDDVSALDVVDEETEDDDKVPRLLGNSFLSKSLIMDWLFVDPALTV